MQKKIFFKLVFILGCFGVSLAQAAVPLPAQKFTQIKDSEPDFKDIMRVFTLHSNLGDAEFRDWEKKIKKAAYLPTLYVGYDHQLRQAESLSVTDNISVSSGIVTVGPEDNDYDLDNNQGQTIRMRAVWNLDEAIFNRYLFALENARANRFKTRGRVEQEIFKIYEERYLYLVQYLSAKRARPDRAEIFYARFLLLTDRLNQLTDNQFADHFWREK